MPALKKEVAVFVAGAAAMGAGFSPIPLSPIPLKEALLPAGSFLLSLAYGILIFGWRQGSGLGKTQLGGLPQRPATVSIPTAPKPPELSIPPAPPPPATPTPPPAPSIELPSVSPPAPLKPPTPPAIEPPAIPEGTLPRPKAPKIQLPTVVVENKVPITMIAAGLGLIIAALPFLIPPDRVPGFSLLIPGVFFFGLGAILLYQRLTRRPVAVALKRFCMHCGFQMLATDVYCGRCHRQPPSGIDTKVCPNCTAVIPALARFCRECGAGQPVKA